MPGERFRLERGAEHLWRLGPRALAEFLAEITDKAGGQSAILRVLSEYERLSPEMVRAVGGRRMPRPRHPLHAIPRDMGQAA